jgi:putative PIN family toxin of toxin-antitoxin system
MISRTIVLDTNVLVSAAIKEHSPPGKILLRVLKQEIVPIICPSIWLEYREVFSRPKFKKWKFPPEWFEYLIEVAILIKKDPLSILI